MIKEKAYVLSTIHGAQSLELARLSGGAQQLLPGVGTPTEGQLETAIEMAEDWLMPHVKGLHGGVLRLQDTSGRWTSGLSSVLGSKTRSWSLTAIEQDFLKVIDQIARRNPSSEFDRHRLFVADLLLVRELAHHGRVVSVSLQTFENDSENRRPTS